MGNAAQDFGEGGGGDYVRTGLETYRTMAASQATLTTAAYNNKSSAPYILLCTTRYARDRMPNGSNTDFWHVEVHPHSLPYKLEAETANTDGTHNLIAELGPGAKGFFQWDTIKSEWVWHGYGEHWYPVLKNDPGAWIVPGSDATSIDGLAYYEDATVGAGVIQLWIDTNSPTRLAVRCLPLNVDGSMGTPGSVTTFVDGANNLSSPYITALSDTVFTVHYTEATTAYIRTIILTRTAGSTTLTFASTAGSTITVAASGTSSRSFVVPFRGDSTKFLFIIGNTAPDSSYHPEIAYCTIANTGVDAAINKNTGVNFQVNAVWNAYHDIPVVEDPVTDGTFWTMGKNTTNTNAHLIKFTIVGTTPTRQASYHASTYTLTAQDDFIFVDKIDGQMGHYMNSAYKMFTMFDPANDAEFIGGSDQKTVASDLNRRAEANITQSGIFGGVMARVPNPIGDSYCQRFTKKQLMGGGVAPGTTLGQASFEMEVATFTYQNVGTPSISNVASIYMNANSFPHHLGNANVRWGYENPMQLFEWHYDNGLNTQHRVKVYEVGSATRWGRSA